MTRPLNRGSRTSTPDVDPLDYQDKMHQMENQAKHILSLEQKNLQQSTLISRMRDYFAKLHKETGGKPQTSEERYLFDQLVGKLDNDIDTTQREAERLERQECILFQFISSLEPIASKRQAQRKRVLLEKKDKQDALDRENAQLRAQIASGQPFMGATGQNFPPQDFHTPQQSPVENEELNAILLAELEKVETLNQSYVSLLAEHQVISENYNALLHENTQNRNTISELQNQIVEQSHVIEDLRNQLRDLKKQLSQNNLELDNLRKQLADKDDELRRAKDMYSTLIDQQRSGEDDAISQLNKQLIAKDEELTKLRSEKSSLVAQNLSDQQWISELENELQTIKEELARLQRLIRQWGLESVAPEDENLIKEAIQFAPLWKSRRKDDTERMTMLLDLMEELDELNGRLKKLEEEKRDSIRKLQEKEKENVSLREELKQLRERKGDSALLNEINVLKQENEFLSYRLADHSFFEAGTTLEETILKSDENVLCLFVEEATLEKTHFTQHSSTFCFVDFFEYDSVCTPVMKGLNPKYALAARYKLLSTKFFVHDILCHRGKIELYSQEDFRGTPIGVALFSLGRFATNFDDLEMTIPINDPKSNSKVGSVRIRAQLLLPLHRTTQNIDTLVQEAKSVRCKLCKDQPSFDEESDPDSSSSSHSEKVESTTYSTKKTQKSRKSTPRRDEYSGSRPSSTLRSEYQGHEAQGPQESPADSSNEDDEDSYGF
ncbi:putative First C2 domain of RPGR-interacting protein 1 [Blattamonas nauphoetae]|uniref:First C2 domain of RPGR-interacting protein 1 n=1 Tax=Blattamonas nauphoetae TaxID=2049346 RepID=A0ABQ9YLM1_9EUKA|nr:putative First C2 domain of RPGR-interacting protein 1 [Blattamonas nauphoetae]